jgi:hypothetical protein
MADKKKRKAEVDVGLPIPLGDTGYMPAVSEPMPLPPVQRGVPVSGPVQSGLNNAVEAQAMNPLLAWMAGQGIDVAAEKTGVKDVLRDRASGLLDLLGIGQAQAAEPAPPADTGFKPNVPTIIAQDAGGEFGSPDVMYDQQGNAFFSPNAPQVNVPAQVAQVATPAPAVETSNVPAYNRPFDPARMSDAEIAADEEAMQAASDALQMGVTSPQDLAKKALDELAESAKNNKTPPKDGFFSRVKGFLGDEEKMMRLAFAFNTLRAKPDAQFATFAADRINKLAGTRGANATIDYLSRMGRPDLAEQIKSGGLTAKEALTLVKLPSDIQGYQYAKQFEGFTGSLEDWMKLKQQQINISDKGETKLQEEIGKGLGTKITEDFTAGTQARSALDSIDLLMGLSENLESATSIPPALRNLVPEGVSDPIDAYRGVMTNVAKSLRIKGEGTMSDRDIDLLIRQAGPVTSNPQARRIMQESLKRKAEINLQLSKAASDFMLERISRRQYLDRVNEINNIPLMDERMRSYISSLGGGAAKPAGGQVKVISVE